MNTNKTLKEQILTEIRKKKQKLINKQKYIQYLKIKSIK